MTTIIAIEGIDGAGKNTLTHALLQHLPAGHLSFPRYGESAPAILAAEALHGNLPELSRNPYSMAAMFALDRAGAIDALTTPGTLILDRYIASNAAYTAARTSAAALNWVERVECGHLRLPRPTLQVLLDTPPAVAQDRAQGREMDDSSRQRDLYERDTPLQERVSEMYRFMANAGWLSPWVVIGHDEDPEQAAPRILQALADIQEARQ